MRIFFKPCMRDILILFKSLSYSIPSSSASVPDSATPFSQWLTEVTPYKLESLLCFLLFSKLLSDFHRGCCNSELTM